MSAASKDGLLCGLLGVGNSYVQKESITNFGPTTSHRAGSCRHPTTPRRPTTSAARLLGDSHGMFSFAARNLAKSGARMLSTSTGAAAKNQRVLMGASAVAVGMAAGVAGYKSECLKIEIDDSTAKKLLSALSGAKGENGPRYNELLPSPKDAKVHACVVE